MSTTAAKKPKGITYVTHTVTKRSVTIVYKKDGKQHQKVFSSNTDEFAEAQQLIADGKKKELVNIIFAAKLVNTTKDKVEIDEATGVIKLNGEELPKALAERLKMFVKAGQDITPLENFWNRLKKNPDEHSRTQLFRYIENHGVTILEDGRFLLYKAINHNMTSKHDGRTLHVVGEYVQLERSRCDSDPHAACSTGLHCAPYKYVTSVYGGGYNSQKYVELIIDPEDMVSVPHDANGQKMRVCRYLVNAIVNMDGVGIRTGLIARLDERPTDNADKGSTMKKAVEHTDNVTEVLKDKKPEKETPPAEPISPKKEKLKKQLAAKEPTRSKAHKDSLTAKGLFERTADKRKAKHDKKTAKKAAKVAKKEAKSKKPVGPAPLKVAVAEGERTTFVGKFFAEAGFSPKARVAIGVSKLNRMLIIAPEEMAEKLFKRHKATSLDSAVTLSDACALRLRNTLFREVGIKKKSLTATYVETNVVSIG